MVTIKEWKWWETLKRGWWSVFGANNGAVLNSRHNEENVVTFFFFFVEFMTDKKFKLGGKAAEEGSLISSFLVGTKRAYWNISLSPAAQVYDVPIKFCSVY